jgi:hypothetical protein
LLVNCSLQIASWRASWGHKPPMSELEPSSGRSRMTMARSPCSAFPIPTTSLMVSLAPEPSTLGKRDDHSCLSIVESCPRRDFS